MDRRFIPFAGQAFRISETSWLAASSRDPPPSAAPTIVPPVPETRTNDAYEHALTDKANEHVVVLIKAHIGLIHSMLGRLNVHMSRSCGAELARLVEGFAVEVTMHVSEVQHTLECSMGTNEDKDYDFAMGLKRWALAFTVSFVAFR